MHGSQKFLTVDTHGETKVHITPPAGALTLFWSEVKDRNFFALGTLAAVK